MSVSPETVEVTLDASELGASNVHMAFCLRGERAPVEVEANDAKNTVTVKGPREEVDAVVERMRAQFGALPEVK